MLIFHAKHSPASLLDEMRVATVSVASCDSAQNIGVVAQTRNMSVHWYFCVTFERAYLQAGVIK